jgi:hypothetical protein
MDALTKSWQFLKTNKTARVVAIAIVLFVFGYGVGRNHKVPEKIVKHQVVDQMTKQQLDEANKTISKLTIDLTSAKNQITELQKHETIKERTVTHKDGTKTTTKVVQIDQTNHTETNQTSHEQTQQTVASNTETHQTTETTTHVDTKISITPAQDQWLLGPSVKIGLDGISNPGFIAERHLFWKAWVGGELTIRTDSGMRPELRLMLLGSF